MPESCVLVRTPSPQSSRSTPTDYSSLGKKEKICRHPFSPENIWFQQKPGPMNQQTGLSYCPITEIPCHSVSSHSFTVSVWKTFFLIRLFCFFFLVIFPRAQFSGTATLIHGSELTISLEPLRGRFISGGGTNGCRQNSLSCQPLFSPRCLGVGWRCLSVSLRIPGFLSLLITAFYFFIWKENKAMYHKYYVI